MTNYDQVKSVKIMRHQGLANAPTIYSSATDAGLTLPAACALMQQESGGHNVYGHDQGGALSGYPERVDPSNFRVFLWLVDNPNLSFASNGVGPSQITARGYFDQMKQEGLHPWDAGDNMFFGFRLLKGYRADTGSWEGAGTKYNGAESYGVELAAKVRAWRDLLSTAIS